MCIPQLLKLQDYKYIWAKFSISSTTYYKCYVLFFSSNFPNANEIKKGS